MEELVVPKKRGRPKANPQEPRKIPPKEFTCRQNRWMNDHLLPGKYVLVMRDQPDGTKRGKVIFIDDDVKSNMHNGLKVVCLCLCDGIQNVDGSVVRKPNRRAAWAGTSKDGSRLTYQYEQIFVPMDLVEDVIRGMALLAGCSHAVEAQVKLAKEVVVEKKSADESFIDDNISILFGRR